MSVTEVTDLDDPRLADYRDLTDVALRRATELRAGLYMAEGHWVIERALAVGHQPRSVLCEPKRLASVVDLLRGHPSTEVYVAAADLLREVTGYHVHRGALAAMHRPELPSLGEILSGSDRVLVLEDLVDHTNVGAAFRSAAALGFDAVVISPQCADPLYRRSVKVSMGAVLGVPWTRAQQWPTALAEIRAAGLVTIALTPASDATVLAELPDSARSRCALLIGSEGPGLTAAAMTLVDHRARIPMYHGIDSLNAAAATAVACYALGPVGGSEATTAS